MLDKNEMRETLIAYADGGMRKYAAAKILHIDVSTLEYRLQKIKKTTGLNPKNFYELGELLNFYNKLEKAERI